MSRITAETIKARLTEIMKEAGVDPSGLVVQEVTRPEFYIHFDEETVIIKPTEEELQNMPMDLFSWRWLRSTAKRLLPVEKHSAIV